MQEMKALSLRTFHLVFILIAIAGADLFGGWALHQYFTAGGTPLLALGAISLAGGFGLIVYAIWFVRKLDRVHIE